MLGKSKIVRKVHFIREGEVGLFFTPLRMWGRRKIQRKTERTLYMNELSGAETENIFVYKEGTRRDA